MLFLTIINSLLHFISITILCNKIYAFAVNKTRFSISAILLVMFASLSGFLDIYNFLSLIFYFLFFIFQLTLCRLSMKDSKAKTIFFVSVTLYLCETIILFYTKSFLDVSYGSNKLISFFINVFLLIACFVCCYTNVIKTIKNMLNSASPAIRKCILFLMFLCMLNVALMSDIQYYITSNDLFFEFRLYLYPRF